MKNKIKQRNIIFYRKDISRFTSNEMKSIKMKKISLIVFFIFFLTIGNYVLKAEAWGYTIQIANRGVWTDYGTETQCRTKLMYDTAGITDCVENNPTSNYIFTNVVGPIKTTTNEIVGGSYATSALCETARTAYIATTSIPPSSCYVYNTATYYVDPGIVVINPVTNAPGSAVSNVYNFLAPIGLGPSINTTDVGVYFNWIFKLAIGLCAALAVIMIIIGGVQYMGDESIFGKTNAKDKILKAILGLLIAIGSWVLLNTINPALTGVNGVNVANVTVDVENIPWYTYESGDNTAGCPSGYGDVKIEQPTPSTINVCNSIKGDLVNLIAAAVKEQIFLSGGGSRKIATQQALRVKNNCPNLTTPSSSCHPNVVAIPGTSNHEKGLAIDFKCDGVGMTKSDLNNKCYKWLVKNAGTYKLLNKLAVSKGEVWHWSTTGY